MEQPNQPNNNQLDKEPVNDNPIIQQKIVKINGQTIIKKYSKGKILGRGGFAKCYELTNLQNKKVVAAKIITKASLNKNRAKQKLISEIKIHKSLHHQNIVQFEHVFEDHQNVYILLELCSNQTLNQLIKRRKRLTQIEVQCYLAQIINALKYLHQHKVIHRDLKLGNLFLNENMQIKLGDFGLATKLQYEGQKKKTICGTPNYIAPQILEGKGHTYQVDVWSVGVIIFTQLIGKPPFQTPEVKATYKKIRACQYTFPQHVTISENAKNLIIKILNLDPSKRPTLDEIMTHPFMNTTQIPKTLPRSTLACPPSKGYCEQFMKPQTTAPNNPNIIINNTNSQIKTPSQIQRDFRKQTTSTQKLQLKAGTTKQQTKQQQFLSTAKQFKPQFNQIKTQPVKIATNTNSNFQSSQNINKKQKINNFLYSQLHVKKWVDYSTKYGLGYLLSDGSTGVYFNDSTKMILDAKGEHLDYIQKKTNQKVDTVASYTLSDYPKERQFQKKVTLLQHFRNYLYADSKIQAKQQTQGPLCYVKKWMKTRHAIMFRLSNKIVQVNFTDKTQIILSSQQKLVVYVNTKGQKSQYPLATALQSKNVQMAKRLKYTKQILTHMLNGTSPPNNTNPPVPSTEQANNNFGVVQNQNNPIGNSSSKTGSSWNLNRGTN